MGDTYWPDGTLADLLDIHVQNYEQDFREYWHLDNTERPEDLSAEEWTLVRLLDKVGVGSIPSAYALRVEPELSQLVVDFRPGDSVERTMRELSGYDVAQTCAEIDLASAAVQKLFEGKKRLATILHLLSKFELSPRAAAYVDRMVQCYVWGLDTECVVMARSVVEAALEEAFTDADMHAMGFVPKRHGFEYWQFRNAATRSGRFSADVLGCLEDVRRAGNDAVHASPGLHEDPIASIAYAVVCLRSLLPTAAN